MLDLPINELTTKIYDMIESHKTVEIFKTNIADRKDAKSLLSHLAAKFPRAKFNIDLHDADRVLRMEGPCRA
jgi:Lhr-like helicase